MAHLGEVELWNTGRKIAKMTGTSCIRVVKRNCHTFSNHCLLVKDMC